MRQGIDGESDKHHPTQPGDQQLMALVQHAYLPRTDNANEDSVGHETTNEAQDNQPRQHRPVQQFGTAGQPERAMAVLRKQAAATILTAPNTYAAEKQGLRKFSVIRDLGIRQLITVTATTKKYLREKRDAVDAFLRGYIEALAYVKAQKDVTMKVIAKYTRQRDPEVLASLEQ